MALDIRIVRAAGALWGSGSGPLKRLCSLELAPEQFLPQKLHRYVAGILVDPGSDGVVHIAHRKVTSRSQTREVLRPGDLLIRGPDSREHWTLAVPPLISTVGGCVRGSRRLTVLTDDNISLESICNLQDLLLESVRTHEVTILPNMHPDDDNRNGGALHDVYYSRDDNNGNDGDDNEEAVSKSTN